MSGALCLYPVSALFPMRVSAKEVSATNTAASEGSPQGCLITSTPDLYQPMDGEMPAWEKSDWPNGGQFNCTWRPSNVIFRNGLMILDLTKDSGQYPYASGEYRTSAGTYSYGYYETRMRAAKGAGLVAGTFFTFAGTWGQPTHNEIDFEFLGKNPRMVQLNYYHAGAGSGGENERMIDLGFDASEEFHNYGFKWTSSSIEWYVDGVLVHSATTNIPQDPSKIMVNFWPGTSQVSGWLGGVYSGNGEQVSYDWIKYLSLSHGTEAKPAIKKAKKASAGKAAGRSISSLLRTYNAFNGADGQISGSTVTLRASGASDAGIALEMTNAISGKLSFDHSGSASGGFRDGKFTVIFIKGDPSGDWRKDAQLGETSITPGNNPEHATLDVPEGTTKINIMLIGSGSVDIKLENVKIN